jgi:hypothetical protein
MNKKFPGLIIAGVAAFLYYKYSKMSADEKKDIVNNLKAKGKQLYDAYLPGTVKQKLEDFS